MITNDINELMIHFDNYLNSKEMNDGDLSMIDSESERKIDSALFEEKIQSQDEFDNLDHLISQGNIEDEDTKLAIDDDNEMKNEASQVQIVEEEKKPLSWIEWIYILSVESLSCADLITDFIILDQLINDSPIHTWFVTFSVIFMISPYLVSYTAMGSILERKSRYIFIVIKRYWRLDGRAFFS